MLGLPSSVKYIDRSKRPRRVFVKRADGSLEEVFSIHLVRPEPQPTEASVVRWYQDATGDDYRPPT